MKKITILASCFCLCAILGIGAWQGGLFETEPTPGVDAGELTPAESYVYEIVDGQFAEYIGGKVIAEDKIGHKLADVSLVAGWKNTPDGEWISQEALRGEVYSIEGISNGVAVALKFLDQGEAVTTTHYYVIMNPDADLSAVEDYIITSDIADNAE